MKIQYFKGSFFHTPVHGQLEFVEEALLLVNEEGIIQSIVRPTDEMYADTLHAAKQTPDFVELAQGQYFLPGFIDLHVHAPQWPQAGVALDTYLGCYLSERIAIKSFVGIDYRHRYDRGLGIKRTSETSGIEFLKRILIVAPFSLRKDEISSSFCHLFCHFFKCGNLALRIVKVQSLTSCKS